MLFVTIVGFGYICRPSSSPICSPICSRLVAGPISALPDEERSSASASTCRRNRDAGDLLTDRSTNPSDRSKQRSGSVVVLPPAYDAPIGLSPAGILRKSASSATSTSICLAKSDRENRSCEDDRTCETRARISLLSSAPSRDCLPSGRLSFTGQFQRFGI